MLRHAHAALAAIVIGTLAGFGTVGTTAAAPAGWCLDGAQPSCVFESRRACERAAVRRGGECLPRHAMRSAPVAAHGYRGAVYPEFPSRPSYAVPGMCFLDDGYGRYRPCDAGGGFN